MADARIDIAVFGGGIVGLWTLARLRAAGYAACLFENDALGGGQTLASQGIIHGGTKYALTGKLTGSAMAIGEMPAIWRAALAGTGEIDLSAVRLLAEHQYLWSSGSLASGMAGFFAAKVMQSRMQALPSRDYPAPFDAPQFRGSVYRLDEPVLDNASLVQALAEQVSDACYAIRGSSFERLASGWKVSLSDEVAIEAKAVVLAAGKGNAGLLAAAGRNRPRMQTRPLHMLMLRGHLPALYAHCLGASANPRLTITSYPEPDGRVVWYLGGQVAEEGVGRTPAEQIAAGKAELAELLPWVDAGNVEWATLPIDRAEVATPGGKRPDDAYVDHDDRIITCWPTKLAFAPRVASLVLDALVAADVAPGPAVAQLSLPRPPVGELPWHGVSTWN
ncbi:FAD-dependent oxidoreductase [Thiosocius teredinicola]|uniref:FAD-dependent oxidoreductase n=1 Tax=Thiosocius teredinicola TaxID=1973002 RepID=UPI002FE495A2